MREPEGDRATSENPDDRDAIRAASACVPADEAAQARAKEREWQRVHLPGAIRELVLDDQQRRGAICWHVFDDCLKRTSERPTRSNSSGYRLAGVGSVAGQGSSGMSGASCSPHAYGTPLAAK
jgi:hypothetical protein